MKEITAHRAYKRTFSERRLLCCVLVPLRRVKNERKKIVANLCTMRVVWASSELKSSTTHVLTNRARRRHAPVTSFGKQKMKRVDVLGKSDILQANIDEMAAAK